MFPPQGGRKHPQQEFLQIDTKNILFICGGAFDGLEKIIEKRTSNSTLGFQTEEAEKQEINENEWYKNVIPHDLVVYGIIPELVGRLPVIASLDGLTEKALVRILSEPKNCLVNQYKKLFALDKVELEFQPEALTAIAKKTIREKNWHKRTAFHYGRTSQSSDVRSTFRLYDRESAHYAGCD